MDAQLFVQAMLLIAGSGGVVGAIVALLKLKPDANTQAVTQTQAAATEWQKLYEDMRVDRDYWRVRAMTCEGEHDDARGRR